MNKMLLVVISSFILVSSSCSDFKDNIYIITPSKPDIKSYSHKFNFHKSNLVDGDTTTSWQVRTNSGGIGEWIEIKLKHPMNMRKLVIWNGFQLYDPEYGDLYFLNSRLRVINILVNGQATEQFKLPDTKEPVAFDINYDGAERIRIEVTGIYKGTRWPNDLAISEIAIEGSVDLLASLVLGFVIIGAVGGILYLIYRNKDMVFKAPASFEESIKKMVSIKPDSFNAEAYEKGKDFEQYVARIFTKQKDTFTITNWNYDVHTKHKDIYVEADRNPDFIIRHNQTGQKIAVECKFRSGTVEVNDGKDQAVQWAKLEQIKHYAEFSQKENIPLFILVGLGGKPKKPMITFCVPIGEAKYPELFMSKLRKYVRLPADRPFEWKDGVLL